MHLALVLILCCVSLPFTEADAAGTLLDNSEYQKLITFDEMLNSMEASIRNHTEQGVKSTAASRTLDYMNVAMMYHQRNQRWKQGGTAESLRFINLALMEQQRSADHAHDDQKLRRSMMLHKANMLAGLGQRAPALKVLDELIHMHNQTSTPAHAPDAWFGSLFKPRNTASQATTNEELSSILYHKAELLLTLYDDFSAAVELFQRSLQLHPCHYLAHLQLVHAMKATKAVTREEWLGTIDGMEQYLLNIRQKAVNTKSKYKFKAPQIEYHVPVVTRASKLSDSTNCNTTASDCSSCIADTASNSDYSGDSILSTVQHTLHNLYTTLYTTFYPTTAVCTFTSDESDLYATSGATRTTTTLSGIYASVNWALFVAADSVQMTGDVTGALVCMILLFIGISACVVEQSYT